MSLSWQKSNTDGSLIHELKENLLDQQKVNAMLLHDKETAVMERDLLREEVLRLFRDGNQDSSTMSDIPPPPSIPPPPIPILHAGIPYSEDMGESGVRKLLGELRLSEGGKKIKEEGTKLVNYLREKAREQKTAMLETESERECAVVKLRSTELDLKSKESRFMKEISDLSEENNVISEEFENMKLVYSLKKVMSREDEIRNEYEKQLDSIEIAMKERQDQNKLLLTALSKAQSERNKMLEKYQKLEDRYKRERGHIPVSRNNSLSLPAPIREVFSLDRSSSISSQTSQRSLPSTSN